jgi:hypothetical protein
MGVTAARETYAKLDALTRGPHHQGQTSREAQAALDEVDHLRAEVERLALVESALVQGWQTGQIDGRTKLGKMADAAARGRR